MSNDFLVFSAFRLAFAPSTDTKDSPTWTFTVAPARFANVTYAPLPGPLTVVLGAAAAADVEAETFLLPGRTLASGPASATLLRWPSSVCATFAGAPPVSAILFGVTAPFFQVPTDANGVSNFAEKYTR